MNNEKIENIINAKNSVKAYLTSLNDKKRTVYFIGTPANIAAFLSRFVLFFSIRFVDNMDNMICEASESMLLVGAKSKISDEIRVALDILSDDFNMQPKVDYITDIEYAEYCRNEEK